MFAMILTHVQMLLGVTLYFISPITQAAFQDFGAAMKDSTMRLYAIEHGLMMGLAVTFITLAYKKAKKSEDPVKAHRTLAIFFSLALVFILSRIPWNVWP